MISLKQLFFILIFITIKCHQNHDPVVTVVTGMFNIGRGDLKTKKRRSFTYYLKEFSKLLKTDTNMVIFA